VPQTFVVFPWVHLKIVTSLVAKCHCCNRHKNQLQSTRHSFLQELLTTLNGIESFKVHVYKRHPTKSFNV
jgi:hypothetical protein